MGSYQSKTYLTSLLGPQGELNSWIHTFIGSVVEVFLPEILFGLPILERRSLFRPVQLQPSNSSIDF